MINRTLFWLAVAAGVVSHFMLARKLDQILAQGARNMTKIDDVNALLGKIDTETNEVAAEVAALRDQITNNGGISAADADAVVAKLSSISDRLTGIGADPANPVPGPVEPGGGTNG